MEGQNRLHQELNETLVVLSLVSYISIDADITQLYKGNFTHSIKDIMPFFIPTRNTQRVITKADHVAKRKASTGLEISTNAAKKTRSSKKGSRAGSSGQAAEDGVEQADDGTLNDNDQYDDAEFAMEGIENLNDVSQGEHINVIPLRTFDPSIGLDVIYPLIPLPYKEVEPHTELSGGVRRATRASSRVSHGINEDASPYVSKVVPAPDAQPLDVDAGANEIASDGYVGPYYEARVGNIVGDVLERDILPIVPRPYYIPYPYEEGSRSESPPYTKDNWEEIHGVNLGLRKKELYKDPKAEHKLSSWDKKHRKYRNERDTLAMENAKIEEELVGTKSQLEHRERQAKEIQDNIASFFQSDFLDCSKGIKSGIASSTELLLGYGLSARGLRQTTLAVSGLKLEIILFTGEYLLCAKGEKCVVPLPSAAKSISRGVLMVEVEYGVVLALRSLEDTQDEQT
ncbi:hypothetical protein Tco_0364503 [Tanacetum coccineum]